MKDADDVSSDEKEKSDYAVSEPDTDSCEDVSSKSDAKSSDNEDHFEVPLVVAKCIPKRGRRRVRGGMGNR